MTQPNWAPPAEVKPAPVPLLLVQAFVNTRDCEQGTDQLLEPAQAAAWLAEAGLRPGELGLPEPADLYLARDVRESIRALLVANGGGPPPDAADLLPLQSLARTARPQFDVDAAGQVSLDPDPAGQIEAQLATLLLLIRDSQRDRTWPRLKACRNSECQWAFYDRSHSRRGAWCDMAVCGNRIKNRRLRERQS